jgi:hypothetical protein
LSDCVGLCCEQAPLMLLVSLDSNSIKRTPVPLLPAK